MRAPGLTLVLAVILFSAVPAAGQDWENDIEDFLGMPYSVPD